MGHYGMKFETTVNWYIGRTKGVPDSAFTCAGDYGNNLITKSLLYSICIMEKYYNTNEFTDEEKKLINRFENEILLHSADGKLINECIDLFFSKI
jgi:hypothetical protein